jgi:LuxR family maltose regulon positive regulatory protein
MNPVSVPAATDRRADGGQGVVTATKLNIPGPRAGIVPHKRLIRALEREREARIVLVSAPAGAGKTTLIGGWHADSGERRPFAWLSLDPADDDPVRFWTYVIEALRRVVPSAGLVAEAALRAPGMALEELALPLLINELAELDEPIVLVLDDYHVLSAHAIHASLAFLADRLPPTLLLVVASRTRPPLPLGRLRARGQLVEVRPEDLRVSGEQAEALLNGVLGLELGAADIERLLARTEGWAAGLQLAGLSLRRLADVPAFIDAFAGDDRHVVDYLRGEVLDGQPDDVREFLVSTSILERLCGPLCDAVTGGEDGAERLLELERESLFVIPLDARGCWFRFHALFAELLREELRRTRPKDVAGLHRRASDWHLAEGDATDAVDHALAAGDPAHAADLVAAHWNAEFNQGRLATVASWLDRLGSERPGADPRLCVARAWLAMDGGRLEDAGRWVAAAAAAGEGPEPEIETLRAVHAFKTGDLGAARRAAAAARRDSPFVRTVASCMAGVTRWWLGEPEAAVAALGEARCAAEESGNLLAFAYATGYLALAEAERGTVEESERLADCALDVAGTSEHFVLMVAHLARGGALVRRADPAGARSELDRAVRLARRGAGRIETAAALLARAALPGGGGAELRREAEALIVGCRDPGPVVAAPIAARRRAVSDDDLSERELAVLRMLATDMSLRDAAAALYISRNTIKTHVRSIYRKLGVQERGEAVAAGRARRIT